MIAEELKRFPVVAALAEAEPEAMAGGKFEKDELTLEIARESNRRRLPLI